MANGRDEERVRGGYIYFIQAAGNGLIKIGFTAKHPDLRLKHLQIGCPITLERLGFIRAAPHHEQALHIRFKRYREHGEWFRPADDLLDFIKDRASEWRCLPPKLKPISNPSDVEARGWDRVDAMWDEIVDFASRL